MIVYILCGIPGAGKSTWAEELKRFHWYNVSIISRDTLRLQLFNLDNYSQYEFSKENEDKVTKEFDAEIDRAILLEKIIVIDNTNCRERYINELIRRFKQTNYRIKIKYFDIPLWKAQVRNIARSFKEKKHVPWSVMQDMKANYDKIDREKYRIYES